MTREDFKKNPPIYKRVEFEGKEYECIYVNTQELLGLDISDDDENENVKWVRCENVNVINQQ